MKLHRYTTGRTLLVFTLSVILSVISTGSLHALNVQTFRPNIGPTGSFRLFGAENLCPKEFSLGLNLNFSRSPLTVQNAPLDSTNRDIVPWAFSQDLQAEVGLHKRFTFGIDLPLDLIRHTPVGGGTTEQTYYRPGDLEIYGRVNILNEKQNHIGIALIPFVELPTGSVSHYTGDDGVNFGVIAAIEKTIGRFRANLNFGYRGHSKEETVDVGAGVTPLHINDELTYGIGGKLDLIKNRLALMGDLTGTSQAKSFPSARQSSPLEAMGGFQVSFLDNNLRWNIAAGSGIISGYGASTYRMSTGLTWTIGCFSNHCQEKARPEPILNQATSIYFDFDRFNINSEAQQVLNDHTDYLKNHPNSTLHIEGHTDSIGSDSYNQKLSEKRANSTLNYLKKVVPNTSRMKAVGYGETKPIESNKTKAGRAKNRRVDLRLE